MTHRDRPLTFLRQGTWLFLALGLLVAAPADPVFGSPVRPSATAAHAQDGEDGDGGELARKLTIELLDIDVELPPLEKMTRPGGDGGQVLDSWRGSLFGAPLRISLIGLARSEFNFDEPDQLADLVLDNMARDPRRGANLRFGEMQLRAGPYGIAPYAALLVAERMERTDVDGYLYVVAGVVEQYCYLFEVDVQSKLSDEARAALENFVAKGIRYSGKPRDPKWTDEEVEARWERSVPDELLKELDRVTRTKNYIIFTNSAGGKAFAKAMEENYAEISKVYPFPEVEGRRLMPVFVFRTPEQYYAFLGKKIGMSLDQASQTKGLASEDWYATWYEAPKDSVHIHEATHQIFRNRLLLSGGGSWFQEGVAEYMEGNENALENFGRGASRRGTYTPLREFFGLQSLLFSSERNRTSGGSAAGDAYIQAGSIIHFVRADKRTRSKFMDFVRAMGSVRRSDVPAIEREIERLFGVDIDGFEAMWKEFYK